jgi:hypothetical protein
MRVDVEINMSPDKIMAAREAVESVYRRADMRIKGDVERGRRPTQAEEDNVELLGAASAALGAVWRAML